MLQVQMAEAKTRGFISAVGSAASDTSGSGSGGGGGGADAAGHAGAGAVAGGRAGEHGVWQQAQARGHPQHLDAHWPGSKEVTGRDGGGAALCSGPQDEYEEVEKSGGRKVKHLFEYAVKHWDADFYFKVNDDVYLSTMQLVSFLQRLKDRPGSTWGASSPGSSSQSPISSGLSQSGHVLAMENSTSSMQQRRSMASLVTSPFSLPSTARCCTSTPMRTSQWGRGCSG
ncbi:hypothetical protein CLOP_g9661 [Closterium sp. NIES-67]|nr:hypothetical protein CLOP_g9661 [Closterium sp. NIES-67]